MISLPKRKPPLSNWPDELGETIDEIGEGFGDLYKLAFC